MTIDTQSSDRKSGRTGATAAIASAALAVGGIAIGAAMDNSVTDASESGPGSLSIDPAEQQVKRGVMVGDL